MYPPGGDEQTRRKARKRSARRREPRRRTAWRPRSRRRTRWATWRSGGALCPSPSKPSSRSSSGSSRPPPPICSSPLPVTPSLQLRPAPLPLPSQSLFQRVSNPFYASTSVCACMLPCFRVRTAMRVRAYRRMHLLCAVYTCGLRRPRSRDVARGVEAEDGAAGEAGRHNVEGTGGEQGRR